MQILTFNYVFFILTFNSYTLFTYFMYLYKWFNIILDSKKASIFNFFEFQCIRTNIEFRFVIVRQDRKIIL